MKKLSLLILLAGFLGFAKAATVDYASYVNPLVGTESVSVYGNKD